ncbi:uncharacterized protein LOC110716662 [Chenopodium quinoa]|uniref:uncharacterized protein LOC110716662 n=1 Tax=Chenopodium quinoa TaxID=63459 RepID=UPI000B77E3B3|nr:uncharacterized protein LOC110716662 [Chenopodium quinoa]
MLTKNIFIRPPAGGFVVNLPKLKKLQLSGYWDDALATIIRGCPILEDLNLVITSHGNCYMFVHLLDLSAHYIKKLVIIRAYDYNVIPTYQLVVNLSKLEEMTLHIPFGLANIRFVGYSSAEFRFPKKINYLSRIAGLAQLISEVRSLKIDNYALEAVCSLENEVVLGMYYDYCEIPSCRWSWNDVVLLLQCCPSLEVLKVEISRYLTKRDALEHWPSCCSPCWSRLKRIKIRYISESDADFEMIKYILNCGKVLELLSVHVSIRGKKAKVSRQEDVLCEKFFRLHNPSGCEIKFCGQYVSSSSKDFIPCRRSVRLHLG